MNIWIDAQLSPRLARWIKETFGVESLHVRDLGLRNAEDPEIFQKAREAQTFTGDGVVQLVLSDGRVIDSRKR